jgi:hypothetical protein
MWRAWAASRRAASRRFALAASPFQKTALKRGPSSGEQVMAAILPIVLFVVAIVAINVFEFGRAD